MNPLLKVGLVAGAGVLFGILLGASMRGEGEHSCWALDGTATLGSRSRTATLPAGTPILVRESSATDAEVLVLVQGPYSRCRRNARPTPLTLTVASPSGE